MRTPAEGYKNIGGYITYFFSECFSQKAIADVRTYQDDFLKYRTIPHHYFFTHSNMDFFTPENLYNYIIVYLAIDYIKVQ